MIGFFSGAYSGAETHVPFPNTAVKGSSGDGTVNLTMGEWHGAGNFFTRLDVSHTLRRVFFWRGTGRLLHCAPWIREGKAPPPGRGTVFLHIRAADRVRCAAKSAILLV